jgi:hypothetical protein
MPVEAKYWLIRLEFSHVTRVRGGTSTVLAGILANFQSCPQFLNRANMHSGERVDLDVFPLKSGVKTDPAMKSIVQGTVDRLFPVAREAHRRKGVTAFQQHYFLEGCIAALSFVHGHRSTV